LFVINLLNFISISVARRHHHQQLEAVVAAGEEEVLNAADQAVQDVTCQCQEALVAADMRVVAVAVAVAAEGCTISAVLAVELAEVAVEVEQHGQELLGRGEVALLSVAVVVLHNRRSWELCQLQEDYVVVLKERGQSQENAEAFARKGACDG
jgi:hypothetical protein